MTVKLTEWYPQSIKPVCDGFYIVNQPEGDSNWLSTTDVVARSLAASGVMGVSKMVHPGETAASATVVEVAFGVKVNVPTERTGFVTG